MIHTLLEEPIGGTIDFHGGWLNYKIWQASDKLFIDIDWTRSNSRIGRVSWSTDITINDRSYKKVLHRMIHEAHDEQAPSVVTRAVDMFFRLNQPKK
jgi:hypothetical protein